MDRCSLSFLLLSDQCANCMCSSSTPRRTVDCENSNNKQSLSWKRSTKKNLMHILYHAPFALNSFNVVVVVGFAPSAQHLYATIFSSLRCM